MAFRGRRIGAAELMKQLEADPEWVAARQGRERERTAREEELQREERPLLEDLAASGFAVASVWDLVNSPGPYDPALPVLLKHMHHVYSDPILEGIARALAVKHARPLAWAPFLAMLKARILPKRVADAVMVAVSAMAQPTDLATIIEHIRDTSLGSQRIFLVPNLTRSKRPEARATLLALRNDPDLRKEIELRMKRSRR